MTYLAVDPGKSTGWATFDDKGTALRMGTCRSPEEFYDFLEALDPTPKVVVCEEFKLFKHKAMQQSGSDMIASQVIGSLRAWARRVGAEVIMQPANIKPIAAMWSGKKPPKNHAYSHEIDAYNHGYYYLTKAGIRK